MFSFLSKVVGLFISEEDADDSSDDDDDDRNRNKSSSNEESVKSAMTKSIEGRVSHLFGSNGLIDGDIYFSFDSVIGGGAPQIGDKVHVQAHKQHAQGGWYADQITIGTDWDNTGQNAAKYNVGSSRNHVPTTTTKSDQHGKQLIDNRKNDDQDKNHAEDCIETVGKVTRFLDNHGLINGNIPFLLNNCTDQFLPSKGDWVTMTIHEDELTNNMEALNIQPLRKKDFQAEVVAALSDHGYIDGDIYFMRESCSNGYIPRKRDKVHGVAIESMQGNCEWRALNVIQVIEKHDTR